MAGKNEAYMVAEKIQALADQVQGLREDLAHVLRPVLLELVKAVNKEKCHCGQKEEE